MTRLNAMTRTICHRAQLTATLALCIGASLVLPLWLAHLGFQAA